ncbi:heme oxygenase (biliverdin-producing) [Corynebacterium auriscanis]|uniref:biliverdin-producing heme oxygenase n=1 Tax=Corynebacterium auriscanis TaxID=99807 RepID=UPI003CF15A9E
MTSAHATHNTTTPLSVALRDCTSQAHERAEGSDFMSELLNGDLKPSAVSALTGQLWFVYRALENAVRRVATTPIVAPIVDTRLQRVAALENDLAHLLGIDWAEQVKMLPATSRYVDRLDSFGEEDAACVVAHHYVRYLGDISGGQVIAARLGVLYDIAPEALKFYDFSAIGKIPPYRTRYRQQLNALPVTEKQRAKLIEEANEAFAMNSAVFTDLYEVCVERPVNR